MVTKQEKIRFIILRTIGNFLVLFALWGVVMTFGPAFYIEIQYRYNHFRNVSYVVEAPKKEISNDVNIQPAEAPNEPNTNQHTFFGNLTGGNKVEILSPVSSQFGLIIPKIGANVAIFPNIDAGDPGKYLPVLQNGVAHAAGTVFPGVNGNIYLFAHSTDAFWNVGRYNAVFYLLKELENGDEIDIFYSGVRHKYRVNNKLIVDPSEVQYLTEQVPYERLILQTCWPPGTTLKRLLILARPERDFIH